MNLDSKKRVMIGHYFSTMDHMVRDTKKYFGDDIFIVGLTEHEWKLKYPNPYDCMFVEEADLPDDEYLASILRQIKAYKIQVFVPNYKRSIFKRPKVKDVLEEVGCKLVCNTDKDCISESKNKIYSINANLNTEDKISYMVPRAIFRTAEQFRLAYDSLRCHGPLVIKPDDGFGGQGFIRIVDDKEQEFGLNRWDGQKLPYHVIELMMEKQEVAYEREQTPLKTWIMLPYMSSEVSIDMLPMKGLDTHLVYPRYKIHRGIERLDFSYEDSKYAGCITPLYFVENLQRLEGYTWPYNVQFRKYKNKWVCMDINLRFSGGAHRLIPQVNLLTIAVCRALGIEEPKPPVERTTRYIISQEEWKLH